MPRLLTLGGLAVLGDDDRPVTSIRGRNLGLLTLLARAGDAGTTRERLASYLWPDSDESRARHSLDQAMYRLRRILGTNVFIDGGSGLLCNREALASDVQAFEGALASGARDAATKAYTGPFLEGFHLSGAPEFERWVDRERRKLHRLFTQALEAQARTAMSEGDLRKGVDHWLRLSVAEPLSARVTKELVRALVLAGDRARALDAAERHVAMVAEDIGAPPDPDLARLMAEVRRPSQQTEPRRSAPNPPPAASRAPVASDSRSSGPAPEEPPTRSGASSPRSSIGRPPPRWARAAVLAAAGLLITAAALRTRKPTDTLPRVLVGEFENRTGSAAFDPLGDLASDWISAGLSQTGLVEVVRDGGARSMDRVEGRIYRVGDSLRVEVQILGEHGGVRTGLEPVFAAASSPSDLLEPLRQGVLGAVSSLHDPRIRDWSGSALRPPDYAAYREFAAGMELHAVPRDLPGAEARFARAAELDPDYLIPRLWQAWSLIMMQRYAEADSVARTLIPRRNAMTPLERAWHDRIREFLAGDTEESYQAARRMVEAAPGSAWTLALANAAIDARRPAVAVEALRATDIANLGLQKEHGWTLLTDGYHRLGQYERELEASEEAIRQDGLGWGIGGPGVRALAALGRVADLEGRLDEIRSMPPIAGLPQGPTTLLVAVTELRAHGHPDAAHELADRLVERSRSADELDFVSRLLHAEVMYELGRWEQAQALLDRVPVDAGGTRAARLEGLLAVRGGDEATARRIAGELESGPRPFGFGAAAFGAARIRAALGERDEALSLVRRAFAEGAKREVWQELHVSRDFEELRDDPELQRVLQPW